MIAKHKLQARHVQTRDLALAHFESTAKSGVAVRAEQSSRAQERARFSALPLADAAVAAPAAVEGKVGVKSQAKAELAKS